MNKYSPISQARLDTCHPELRALFEVVLPYFDHSILCGHRSEDDQEACYRAKNYKLQWPESKHNSSPAMAIDAAPYDLYKRNVDYDDIERLNYFAGFVMGIAAIMFDDGDMKYKVRWGNDWDLDTDLKDNTAFRDRCHFELVSPNG